MSTASANGPFRETMCCAAGGYNYVWGPSHSKLNLKRYNRSHRLKEVERVCVREVITHIEIQSAGTDLKAEAER